MTVDDVRDIIEDPEADAAHDTFLVHDAAGEPVGFAFVIPKGASDLVDMDLYAHPAADPALAPALLARCERRAAEQGRARGHEAVHVDKGTHRQDAATKTLLSERGYAVATTFHRMRLELEDPPPAPAVRDGFALEQVAADDEAGLRAAHGVKEAAFTRHFGSVAQTYEEWRTFLAGQSDIDLSQLWLVRDASGEPAAMLLGTDAFVADDNAGYVLTVATAPAYRGKGLAKALLLTAFAEMRRRGRVAALLHVDAANVTDALGLYESVGMRPFMQIDILRRTLPTGLDAGVARSTG
jgi:ribosomal protein S18 acetylase RimI-like enzyme